MSNLYSTIEALCYEKEISITTMCKESGVNRGSLTDLKSGRKKQLAPQTLSKIADYFGVTVDSILGREINPTVKAAVTDADIKMALFGEDNEVTDEMWKEVKIFVEYLKFKNINGNASICLEPIKMNFSQKLKELRKSKNITQEELAKAIGAERSSVGKYETGSIPSIEKLTKIAQFFDVSTSELLDNITMSYAKTPVKTADIENNDFNASDEMWMKQLKKLRQERGLLQKDIAAYLGIDRTTYVKYENGISEPDFTTLKKISILFDVSIDFILGNEKV